jgi:hypothetical protein
MPVAEMAALDNINELTVTAGDSVGFPAQIVRTGLRLTYRFLGWNRWQPAFFRLLSQLRRLLRC